MSPKEIVAAVRSLKGVCLTSVGMRDAGQSDFKNRHRIYDLKPLPRSITPWACSAQRRTAARAGMWAS